MLKRCWTTLATIALVTLAIDARAQYQGIPNYVGPGAGFNFRSAINQRFSGLVPISPLIVSRPFATLPAEQDGMILFCNDCLRTTPCTGGGSGAFALGARGVWSCSNSALEQSLSMGGNAVNGVAGITPSNDTLAQHNIGNFSINGQINVRDPYFGATASTVSGTASMTSGNATITMDAVHDFAVGQHIAIYGAGAPSSLTAPTLAVQPEAYPDNGTGLLSAANKVQTAGQLMGCWVDNLNSVAAWQPSHLYADNGGNANDEIAVSLDGQWYGFYHGANTSFTSAATIPDFKSVLQGPPRYMGTPWINGAHVSDNGDFGWVPFGVLGSSPLANTSCSTSYSYEVCPVDANGGVGACSTIQTLTNGAAVLSPSNTNVLTITNPAGAVADLIGRCKGASCTPGFYSVIPVFGTSTATQTYFDFGNAQGQYLDAAGAIHTANASGSQPMPAVVNPPLLTTIVSCGTSVQGAACTSTNFTLATAPAVSGTNYVVQHDDGPAINAAVAASCPNSTADAAVYIPAGNYNIATTINLSGCAGLRVRGETAVGGGNTTLNWIGGLGATFVQMFKTRNALVESLTLTGLNGATPAVGVDIDNIGAGSVTSTRNALVRQNFAYIANPVRLASQGNANSEGMTFRDINVGIGADGGYTAFYVAGAGQTDNEQFQNIQVSYGPWNYLFDLGGSNANAAVGSVMVERLNSSALDAIGVYLHGSVKRVQLHDWYAEGLARLTYDDSGFGSSVSIENSYFSPTSVAPDSFYVVPGYGQTVSFNNWWNGAAPMKLNVGTASIGRRLSLRLTSFGDIFSDPQAVFTPFTNGANYSVSIMNASGLTDTGNGGSSPTTATQRIDGPLVAPTLWGGLSSNGRITTAKVGTIPAPTATTVGTGAGVTHNYYLVCHDANGGTSAVSAGGQDTNSPSALSASNYVSITWNYTPGCIAYDVYKDATTGASLLASNVAEAAQNANGIPTYTVLDQGQALSSATAPTVDTTGDFQVAGALSAGTITTAANGNLSINGSGLLGEGSTLFASLPSTCTPGQEIYCSDCKSVADGVTMGSTCVGGGAGSTALCKAANAWKCGR